MLVQPGPRGSLAGKEGCLFNACISIMYKKFEWGNFMERTLQRWVVSGLVALCLALFATIAPVAAASPQNQTQAMTSTPFQGTVTGYANVRSGPSTNNRILAVDRPG